MIKKQGSFFNGIVGLVLFSFLYSTVAAPFAQASIWQERRAAAKNSVPSLMAMAPAQSAITSLSALTSSQQLESSAFQSQKIKSSLSASVQSPLSRSLLQAFSADGEVVNAYEAKKNSRPLYVVLLQDRKSVV